MYVSATISFGLGALLLAGGIATTYILHIILGNKCPERYALQTAA